MPAKKEKPFSMADALTEILSGLATNSGGMGQVDITDFAERIVFNGKAKLHAPQRAVLKAFYNEPLIPEEEDILYGWKEDGRTTWTPGRVYTAMSLEAGRRSGKTTIASIIVLKEFHSLLSLTNPAEHYNLFPSDPIQIFICSQTADQAKETFFDKLRGWCGNSNFFRGLVESKNIELLRQTIRCDSKNIGIYSKHTNVDALVGYNLKLMVLDEIALWTTSPTGENIGDVLWDTVGAATATFGSDGRKLAISTARYEGDNIDRLYKKAELDPTLLGFRLKTWHLNPNMQRTNPVVVSAYIQDEDQAMREWEGIRKSATGNFFSDISGSVRGDSVVDAVEEDLDVVNEMGQVRHYVTLRLLRLQPLPPLSDIETYGHVDYGLRRDSAAFAFCHPAEIEPNRWGVVVDGYLEWTPRRDAQGKRREVNFDNVEKALLEVSRKRNMRHLTFDQFQSASTIQRFHTEGIWTEEASTTLDSQLDYFTTLRSLDLAGLLILPRDSVWSPEVKKQLLGLTTQPCGHDKMKFVHTTTKKDLADALANAVYRCYNALVRSGRASQIKSSITTVKAPASRPGSGLPLGRHTPASLGVEKRLRAFRNRRR